MVARIGNDMEFANPKILWLLVVIPLLVAYYVWRSLQGGASIVISSTESLRKAPRTVRYYYKKSKQFKQIWPMKPESVAGAIPEVKEQPKAQPTPSATATPDAFPEDIPF